MDRISSAIGTLPISAPTVFLLFAISAVLLWGG
jgi:hypothetical protein